MKSTKRIESFDILKGLMALSIVIYHYFNWLNINPIYPIKQTIDSLGVYAVSVFFIISGVTLYLSNANKSIDEYFLKEYFVKRLVRIVPIFYIATTVNILFMIIQSQHLDLWQIFVNYSLLFGLIDYGNYIVTGGWYVGIQIVFYLLFPFLLWVIKKSRIGYIIIFGLSIIITLIISTYVLSEEVILAEQWISYISPFNQLFYFMGGILFGWIYKNKIIEIKQYFLNAGIILMLLVFIFIPRTGADQIHVVTDHSRFIFSIIIFLVVFLSMYLININKNNIFNRMLNNLGEISYSLFLLHPIVYTVTNSILIKINVGNDILIFLTAIAGSVIVSLLSNKYIEKSEVWNIIISKVS